MKLYRRKDRKSWFLRDGKNRISLNTTRKTYAQQLLEEYQAKQLGIYRVSHKRVSEFVRPYLERCRQFNKGTTLDDKQRTLKFFQAQAGDPWLRQINTKMIQTYLESRIAKRSQAQISAERWNSERQILNNFFNYLIGEHALKENPAKGIEKKKIIRNKKLKVITREQENILDLWLAEQTEELLRVKTVAVHTGMRAMELTNLTWPDVDLEREMLRVSAKGDWSPKNYKERLIPLNRATVRALREQKLKRAVLGKFVFCRQDGRQYGKGLNVAMSRAFRAAGLGEGGLHVFRHTFATRYLEAGGILTDLKELLGHADIRTTQRYLHANEVQIRRIVERMGK